MTAPDRRALHPGRWPRHDRPTSPGIARGGWIFLSGQVGTLHQEGRSAGPAAYEQTLQALRNAEEVLAEAGGTLADLVSVTVHLADRADAAEMNRAYAAIMPQPWPARVCVDAGLARPELRVEISGIAVLDPSRTAEPTPRAGETS